MLTSALPISSIFKHIVKEIILNNLKVFWIIEKFRRRLLFMFANINNYLKMIQKASYNFYEISYIINNIFGAAN